MADNDVQLGLFFEGGYNHDNIEGSPVNENNKNPGIPLNGPEFALGPELHFSTFDLQLGAYYSYSRRNYSYYAESINPSTGDESGGLTTLPGGTPVDETVGSRSNQLIYHRLGVGGTILTNTQPLKFGNSNRGLNFGVSAGHYWNVNGAQAPATQKVKQDDGTGNDRIVVPYDQRLGGTTFLQGVVDMPLDNNGYVHLQVKPGYEVSNFRDVDRSGFGSFKMGVSIQGHIPLGKKREKPPKEPKRGNWQITWVKKYGEVLPGSNTSIILPQEIDSKSLMQIGYDQEDADRIKLSNPVFGVPFYGETGHGVTRDFKITIRSEQGGTGSSSKTGAIYLIIPENVELAYIEINSDQVAIRSENELFVVNLLNHESLPNVFSLSAIIISKEDENLKVKVAGGEEDIRVITDSMEIAEFEAELNAKRKAEAREAAEAKKARIEAQPEVLPKWSDYWNDEAESAFNDHKKEYLDNHPDFKQQVVDLMGLSGVLSVTFVIPVDSKKKPNFDSMKIIAKLSGDLVNITNDVDQEALAGMIASLYERFRWPKGFPKSEIEDARKITLKLIELPRPTSTIEPKATYEEFLTKITDRNAKDVIENQLQARTKNYFEADPQYLQRESILLRYEIKTLADVKIVTKIKIAQALLDYVAQYEKPGENLHFELKFQMNDLIKRLEEEIPGSAVPEVTEKPTYEGFLDFIADKSFKSVVTLKLGRITRKYFSAPELDREEAANYLRRGILENLTDVDVNTKIEVAETYLKYAQLLGSDHLDFEFAMESALDDLKAEERASTQAEKSKEQAIEILKSLDSTIFQKATLLRLKGSFKIVGGELESPMIKYLMAEDSGKNQALIDVMSAIRGKYSAKDDATEVMIIRMYSESLNSNKNSRKFGELVKHLKSYEKGLVEEIEVKELGDLSQTDRQARAEKYGKTFQNDLATDLNDAVFDNDALSAALPTNYIEFVVNLKYDNSFSIEVESPNSFIGKSKVQIEALIKDVVTAHSDKFSPDFPRLYVDRNKDVIPIRFKLGLKNEEDFDKAKEAEPLNLTKKSPQQFFDDIVALQKADYISGEKVFSKAGIERATLVIGVKITPDDRGMPVASNPTIINSTGKYESGETKSISLTGTELVEYLEYINKLIQETGSTFTGASSIDPARFTFRLEDPSVVRRINESGSRTLKKRVLDNERQLFEAQHKAYSPLVQEAYKDAKKVAPNLSWRGTVKYTVDRTGKVVKAEVLTGQAFNDPGKRGSQAFEKALKEVYMQFKFPTPPSSMSGDTITLIREYTYNYKGKPRNYTDEDRILSQKYNTEYDF